MSNRCQEEVIDFGLLGDERGESYETSGGNSAAAAAAETCFTSKNSQSKQITCILVIQVILLFLLLFILISFTIVICYVFKKGAIQIFFVPFCHTKTDTTRRRSMS